VSSLAIIDGDVLAYQACRPRWEKKVIDNTNNIYIDENGKKKPLEFTKEEDRRYLEESWTNFKKDLKVLLDTVYCTNFLMAVKGEDNFRNYLYPDYKKNRHPDPNKQNIFVPVLRQLAVAEDLAIAAHGREADDLLRIWAEEARAAGDDYVICTIDKDLRCIPGKYFNMRQIKVGPTYTKVESRIIENISEKEALRHYYEQLLKGDPTDYIPGIPRVGDKKAKEMLEDCQTEEEFQLVVVIAYKNAYEDEWKEYLLSNGKMIHLQKDFNDYFTLENWSVIKEL
jgi:5'-3' exonuclease